MSAAGFEARRWRSGVGSLPAVKQPGVGGNVFKGGYLTRNGIPWREGPVEREVDSHPVGREILPAARGPSNCFPPNQRPVVLQHLGRFFARRANWN